MGFLNNKVVQILLISSIPIIGSAIFSIGANPYKDGWFEFLQKPSWNPPGWLFGPVWFLLYYAMGYASYRVWQNGEGFSGAAKIPLIFFIIQLLLNWTWT